MATQQDVWRRIGTATRVFNAEIKQEIVKQNAVDTGRMRNVSKIVNVKWDVLENDFSLEIASTYYFHGVSPNGYVWKTGGVDVRKSSKYKGGKVNRNITQAFMKRAKVLEQIEKIAVITIEYQIDQQFK